jgi:hypothetical protein
VIEKFRVAAADWLILLACRIRGRTVFWRSEAHPTQGCFATGFIKAWDDFGKPCHWRLSWAHSPHSAMFIGPNNEIISVSRPIRDEIERLRRSA